MMKGGIIAYLCLAAVLVVGVQSLGMQSNLQFVEWVLRYNGNWTTNTNWLPPAEPSTIDDALIYTYPSVVVTLNQNRVIRSLEISNGNEVVVTDGAILAVNQATLARPGFFVSASTGLETPCPAFTIQPLRNQAYCIDCTLFGQIANGAQTQCVFCPAGKIFSAASPTKCSNCPQYQDSDGLGSGCRNCPAHTSSPGGVPCSPCPYPKDSHSGGPCLICLPNLRETTCACNSANGVCRSTDDTNAALSDPVTGLSRQACSCLSGVDGPACNIFNRNVVTNPSSFSFVYNHNNIYDTVSVVLPATFSANYATLSSSPLYAYTTSQWNANPATVLSQFGPAPAGFSPTGFTFQIQLWVKDTSVVIPLQELKVPMRASIPWDHLASQNPWRFELFYWNVVENRWVQVIRNCVGQPNTKRDVPDLAQFGFKNVNTDGTLSWDIYQATANYVLFQADATVTSINGTSATRLNPNAAIPPDQSGLSAIIPAKGNARVPEITTGVTGILPLPPVVDPGQRPGEPIRKPIENFPSNTSSSASILMASSLVILGALVLIFF